MAAKPYHPSSKAAGRRLPVPGHRGSDRL